MTHYSSFNGQKRRVVVEKETIICCRSFWPAAPKQEVGREPPCSLESTIAGLLVDMAVAFALLAVLEEHGRAHNEEGVDADHSIDGGEDVVDEDVGEIRNRSGATALEGSSSGTGALGVGDEGGRRAVEISTALELTMLVTNFKAAEGFTYGSLHELLDAGVRGNPEFAKVGFGREGQNPKVGTDDETEEAAEGNEVA